MNTESSIPINISQVLSKGRLFDKGKLSLQDEVLDGVTRTDEYIGICSIYRRGLERIGRR